VDFESVPIGTYTLHMETLAADWAMWRLRLLTLGAVRLGGLSVRVCCTLRSSVSSSFLRVVLVGHCLVSYRHVLLLR
jgi:hypothetical protein